MYLHTYTRCEHASVDHTHRHTNKHTHTYTHIYTHTHTHTHTCTQMYTHVHLPANRGHGSIRVVMQDSTEVFLEGA